MAISQKIAKSTKLLLLLFISFSFVKCMGPKRTEYITFHSVYTERDNFVIRVGLYGQPQFDRHLLYKVITEGSSPYTLHVTAIYQNMDEFSSIRVLSANISGLNGIEILTSSELLLLKKDFGASQNPEGYTAGGRFANLELDLQPYLIEGQIEVCSSDKCWIEEFSAILNYTIEHKYGFTAIDRAMSV